MIEDVFKLLSFFPDAFINSEKELILIPKINLFFQLNDVQNRRDLIYKLLAWCSHDFSNSKKALSRLNRFLKTNFETHEMEYIYKKIGNGANKDLAYKFIDSDFDMEVLDD